MKGRDVKMLKLVKPEMKPALDAALDAALSVLLSDPEVKKGRDERLAQAKAQFPGAGEEEIKKIQDMAALHVLVGAMLERAESVSPRLLILVAESFNRMTLAAVLETMAGDSSPEPKKEETKIASESDIPNVIPMDLRNMRES